MTLSVSEVDASTVRIRYFDGKIWIDLDVPRSELTLPKKLGRWEKTDVDWGLKDPPSPKRFEELTFAETRKYKQQPLIMCSVF